MRKPIDLEHERSGIMKTIERRVEVEPGRVDASDVMADIAKLAADLEHLLKAAAGQTGEQLAQVRARAEESLQAAHARMAGLRDATLATSCSAGRATNRWVRANPWTVIGFGAMAGLVLGWTVARGAGPRTESH